MKKRYAGTEEVATVPAKSEKRFAVTEEVASVPAKGEKEVCGNRGSSQRSCKE
ncbi:hypothetical protein QA612_03795 [Evansella sp. AB-P1]|uniref:hypothetical protein n=1 Tax=Evansella sp. AB-P1 TaxID=3037653 RepID=UPI00241FC94A|nr:hypothetical protein [Evansella sp. AB-P1]MDG5786601.1 hypothetical protein [Evansella sp. AB-P1]